MQRQEKDCRKLAEASGWYVVEVFQENDTSAFRRRQVDLPVGGRGQRVVRPEFRRLLDCLEQGRFDALITYDLDRVARDPRDLEDRIDIKEARGCQVKSVTGSLRLDSDADVTMARVMVAIANKSSRDTSRRVARRAEQRARRSSAGWCAAVTARRFRLSSRQQLVPLTTRGCGYCSLPKMRSWSWKR